MIYFVDNWHTLCQVIRKKIPKLRIIIGWKSAVITTASVVYKLKQGVGKNF